MPPPWIAVTIVSLEVFLEEIFQSLPSRVSFFSSLKFLYLSELEFALCCEA